MHEQVDFAAVFDALPTPYLVLSPDLVIVASNRARELATGRPRESVLGQHLFTAFPDDPADPEARATALLAESIERVLATGLVDTMPVQRYNIPTPGGGFTARWWLPVNAPLLDADGRVALVVHRVEDVSAYMGREPDAHLPGTEELEAAQAVYLHSHALREALTNEAETARRLAGLMEVTRRLAAATGVDELTDIVVHHGLVALGADAGAVCIREEDADVLDVTFATLDGERIPDTSHRLPLSDRHPAAVAASTGEVVVLPDRAASLAWGEQMARAVEVTDMDAWVSLPLTAADRIVGSLTIAWRDAHELSPSDTRLLGAFATLCGQALRRLQLMEHEARRVQAERTLSETLQLSLLSDPVQVPGLEVAVRYLPSAQHARVGGDWYDSFTIPNGSQTFVVGDVSGHDRDAAAVMAQLRNILRGVSITLGEPPAAVLTGLDRSIDALGIDSFATAVLAQIDPLDRSVGDGRTVHWSNAGHYAPLLVRPDGDAAYLESTPELLLGLNPEVRRSDHSVHVTPGTTIVLFTDGLVERRGASVKDGLAWLQETARGLHELSAEELCDEILRTIAPEHDDDIALLAVRVTG